MFITLCPWCNRAPVEQSELTCAGEECQRKERRLGASYRKQINGSQPERVEVPDTATK